MSSASSSSPFLTFQQFTLFSLFLFLFSLFFILLVSECFVWYFSSFSRLLFLFSLASNVYLPFTCFPFISLTSFLLPLLALVHFVWQLSLTFLSSSSLIYSLQLFIRFFLLPFLHLLLLFHNVSFLSSPLFFIIFSSHSPRLYLDNIPFHFPFLPTFNNFNFMTAFLVL